MADAGEHDAAGHLLVRSRKAVPHLLEDYDNAADQYKEPAMSTDVPKADILLGVTISHPKAYGSGKQVLQPLTVSHNHLGIYDKSPWHL